MNIGILDAFPSEEIKIQWHDTPLDAYIRFMELAAPGFDTCGYEITQGDYPQGPKSCDAYLITGSPKGVYDQDAWILWLKDFIRECFQSDKKLVGICFGHQILAEALGGRVCQSDKGWGLGLSPFDVITQKPWMNDHKVSCQLHFVHQDQVEQLPPEAELLASNDFCPNLMFDINDQVLGIQGHPEFTRAMMFEIIESLDGRLPAQICQAAQVSLDQGTADNRLFAHWITNFLKI